MKKKLYYLFIALLAVGTTCFVACSDEEVDGTDNPQEISEEGTDLENPDEGLETDMSDNAREDMVEGVSGNDETLATQHQAFINILRALAGVEEVTFPLTEKYEPTYGIVLDESNPYVRAMVCNTVGEAEALFQAIVGVPQLLTTTSDGFSFTLQDVQVLEDGTTASLGKLNFHRGDGAATMGSVDVRIPSIPHLIRIDYLPPSAMPDNGPNDSPYQLGDLVYLPAGNTYCPGYYVCIRQTVSGSGGLLVHLCEGEPGGQETINLDGDKQGCWYPFNNSKGMSTESGHIEAYISFLMTEKALVDNLKFYLNGKVHDRKPTLPDKISHIFPGGFANDNGYVYKSSNGKGARIFYNAHYTSENYYWIFGGSYRRTYYWWVTNNCTENTNWSKYITSHTSDYYTDDWWKDFIGGCNPFTMNVITFKNQTVSGATIEYSPSSQNMTFENDARFVTQQHLGWVYTSSNRLYETAKKAIAAGQTPIGVVVYVNDGSDFGNKVTEKDDDNYGHGLVLAASNVFGNPSLRWNPGSSTIAPLDYEWTQYVDKKTGAGAALTDFGGLEKTIALDFEGSDAANAALNFDIPAPTPITTRWFLPSAAQWIAIMCKPGLGGQPMPGTTGSMPIYMDAAGEAFNNINAHLKGTGFYTFGSSSYWSSSAYSGSVGLYLNKSGGTHLTWYNASKSAKIRPILAF